MSSKNNKKRVVVTGLGVVSSLGIGWQEFWKNLVAGKSGISKISLFDPSPYNIQHAGEVKGFSAEKYIKKEKLKTLGRSSQMAIVAAQLALKDAQIPVKDLRKKPVAVCIGTTTGEQGIIENYSSEKFSNKKNKFKSAMTFSAPSSSISANLAQFLKVNGPNIVFGNACAAGNYATSYGYDLIKKGKVDTAIVGGADGFSRLVFTGFSRLFAVATDKCRPFDKNRTGMIPAEGAGVIILESLDKALKRKAKIYAEVIGYGMACDASHMTNPSVKGIVKGLKHALNNAHLKSDKIDYINAHGTGTKENDKAESDAYNAVFGKKIKSIPVSSIKSMLGHTMGAAATLETIACCLAMTNSQIPPTINHLEDDPKINIDCVPNISRQKKLNCILNNSQAFGGNNSCLIFKRIIF